MYLKIIETILTKMQKNQCIYIRPLFYSGKTNEKIDTIIPINIDFIKKETIWHPKCQIEIEKHFTNYQSQIIWYVLYLPSLESSMDRGNLIFIYYDDQSIIGRLFIYTTVLTKKRVIYTRNTSIPTLFLKKISDHFSNRFFKEKKQ